MKRTAIIIMTMFMAARLGAAGSGESQGPEDSRALDAATANPVTDTSGYIIRTAAHWPGPDENTIVGRWSLKAWEDVCREYDVDWEWIQTPNPYTSLEKLTASVLMGEPFADLVWIGSSDAIPALVNANLIMPLDDYLDLDDPRWPKQISQFATYRGHTYGVIPWVLAGGSGVWYNRSLLQREGLPDPQVLQERGEWTWDAYFDIARSATKDTSGDGQIDQWGLTIGYEIEYPLIYSNGGRVVDVQPDGTYRFALDSSEALEALEFVSEIYRSNIASYKGESLFISGRAALYGGELFQGNHMMTSMEDEYGYVFYPRGPRVDDYQCVAGGGVMIVFPSNLRYPPEQLGEILSATVPFEIHDQVQQEFMEGQLIREVDIRTAKEMIDKTQYTLTDNFPGLKREVGKIFRKIRMGSSPSSAVQEYMLSAQATIDAVR